MLIGLTATNLIIDVRFRAHSILGVVERHVELSWEEASDLHRLLGAILEQDVGEAYKTAHSGQLGERRAKRVQPAARELNQR